MQLSGQTESFYYFNCVPPANVSQGLASLALEVQCGFKTCIEALRSSADVHNTVTINALLEIHIRLPVYSIAAAAGLSCAERGEVQVAVGCPWRRTRELHRPSCGTLSV